MLTKHKDVLLKLEQLEKKMIHTDQRATKHEEDIQLIFNALKKLLESPKEPREMIGYKSKKK